MYYYGTGYNAPYPTTPMYGQGYGWGNTWAVILVIFLLLIIVGVWLNGSGCGFGNRCCGCHCNGC